jgi:hypothetical protein
MSTVGEHTANGSLERRAEELVRLMRILLDDHGDAVEKALKKSLGKDRARSRLRQLESLVEALEEELWGKASGPDDLLVTVVASGIKLALKTVATAAVAAATTVAVTQALDAAQTQAYKVLECADLDAATRTDAQGDDEPARQPTRSTGTAGLPFPPPPPPLPPTLTPGRHQPDPPGDHDLQLTTMPQALSADEYLDQVYADHFTASRTRRGRR